jgi:hypothetical protein
VRCCELIFRPNSGDRTAAGFLAISRRCRLFQDTAVR